MSWPRAGTSSAPSRAPNLSSAMSAGGKRANTRAASAGSCSPRSSSVRARLARLSKDSLIYGLGGAAARYTGLLLLPIYTRVFRPDEYGILESIVNLSALLLAITMLGLDGAAPLLYFATDDQIGRASCRERV